MNINNKYNDLIGYTEVNDFNFEVFDDEEVIEKFKKLY